jgi:hypothetical protein
MHSPRSRLRRMPAIAAALSSMLSASAVADSEQWLRVLHARSSESDFSTAIAGDFAGSKESNYLVGLTWGRMLNERVFGWPVALSGNVGVQRLFERGYQDNGWGGTAFVKLHYDWKLPLTEKTLRLGFGEGLSYVTEIPMSEQRDFATKGVESNRLMNYLEWTVDLPLRQFSALSPSDAIIRDISVGFTVWHRSSVFGLFADARGGINYLGFNVEMRY